MNEKSKLGEYSGAAERPNVPSVDIAERGRKVLKDKTSCVNFVLN